MRIVEKKAWNFDPASMGYEWDEEAKQDYQRHLPEDYGYAVLRPVKKCSEKIPRSRTIRRRLLFLEWNG